MLAVFLPQRGKIMTTETENTSLINQRVCEKLVEREVVYCVSSLVYELMQKMEEFPDWQDELMDLSRSLPTAEDLLNDSSHTLYEDSMGASFALPDQMAGEYNSISHPDEDKLDELRDEFLAENGVELTDPESASEVADDLGLEISEYESEVLEHWIVSDWLARNLADRGETVCELMGLTIWGRCTSGQSIALDGIIEDIAKDMEILHGQANHGSWAE